MLNVLTTTIYLKNKSRKLFRKIFHETGLSWNIFPSAFTERLLNLVLYYVCVKLVAPSEKFHAIVMIKQVFVIETYFWENQWKPPYCTRAGTFQSAFKPGFHFHGSDTNQVHFKLVGLWRQYNTSDSFLSV